jgi:hypothetical protein
MGRLSIAVAVVAVVAVVGKELVEGQPGLLPAGIFLLTRPGGAERRA